MQFSQSLNRPQLPLFEAFLGLPSTPLKTAPNNARTAATSEAFSELHLSGSENSYRHLLGPILREISQSQDQRWLTLIAPASSLNQSWLRSLGLDLSRLLLLHPSNEQSPLDIACRALSLGRSHTVISWLTLTSQERTCLSQAATIGHSQSLNICLS